MFVLMGDILAATPIGRDLFRAAHLLLRKLPGSLAVATVFACAAFGSVCGSSPVTAATIGQMSVPEMRRRGYDNRLALGATAAGGTLGILIPPSVSMIIYGILTDTSIGKLFIAGIVPGLMLACMLSATVILEVLPQSRAGACVCRGGAAGRLVPPWCRCGRWRCSPSSSSARCTAAARRRPRRPRSGRPARSRSPRCAATLTWRVAADGVRQHRADDGDVHPAAGRRPVRLVRHGTARHPAGPVGDADRLRAAALGRHRHHLRAADHPRLLHGSDEHPGGDDPDPVSLGRGARLRPDLVRR